MQKTDGSAPLYAHAPNRTQMTDKDDTLARSAGSRRFRSRVIRFQAMLLYLQKSDGTDQNSVNIQDAVWSVPANQTQIAAWITAQNQGFTFYTDTPDDPDDQTLLNMGQVQTWIAQQGQAASGGVSATLPGTTTATATTAPTASTTPWGAIALFVLAGVAAVAVVAAARR